MRRRDFLAIAGTATVAGLAGCSTSTFTSDESPSEPVPMPVVPEQYRENWRVAGETETTFSAFTLTGNAKLKIFENTELRERVKNRLGDDFDAPVAVAFISYGRIEGTGAQFATPRMIANEIEPVLHDIMSDAGLENISSTPLRYSRPQHQDTDSTTREYTAEFKPPVVEKEINLFGVTRTIKVDPSPVKLTALLDVRKPTDDTVYVTGGVFPRVDPGSPDWTSIRGGSGMGWLTGGFIDLVVDPDTVREDVIRIIENAQIP